MSEGLRKTIDQLGCRYAGRFSDRDRGIALNEGLEKALVAIAQGKVDPDHVEGYVLTAIKHHLINEGKKRRAKTTVDVGVNSNPTVVKVQMYPYDELQSASPSEDDSYVPLHNLLPSSPSAEDEYLAHETFKGIQVALAAWNDRDREIICAYFNDEPDMCVAERLKISQTVLRALRSRLLAKLRAECAFGN